MPDQTVRDGVITMQVIEGELSAIEITGNRWSRANYLRQRLALDLEPPLNIVPLQQRWFLPYSLDICMDKCLR